MKLPHPADPGGNAEGCLYRADVLEALYRNGVAVQRLDNGLARLEKDDVLEVQDLPEIVPGKMIRYLVRTLSIPLEDFSARRKNIH